MGRGCGHSVRVGGSLGQGSAQGRRGCESHKDGKKTAVLPSLCKFEEAAALGGEKSVACPSANSFPNKYFTLYSSREHRLRALTLGGTEIRRRDGLLRRRYHNETFILLGFLAN